MGTIMFIKMDNIIEITVIRHRYTQTNMKRAFSIPGGKVGMWIVWLLGLFGGIAGIILSFIPPSQINTGSPVVYVGILIVGVVAFSVVPFIVYACRKPGWFDPATQFEPFDFEIEGRKASQKSKWDADYVPPKELVDAFVDKRAKRVYEWISLHGSKEEKASAAAELAALKSKNDLMSTSAVNEKNEADKQDDASLSSGNEVTKPD